MNRKQCNACPWRKDVVPDRDIPNGYCQKKHRALKSTIADGSMALGGAVRAMACHESNPGKEFHCVGWLANQLGPGNNIALRLMLIQGAIPDFELVGEQHEHFNDTLPTRKKRI